MLRNILFIITTACYLWWLDLRVLFFRIVWTPAVEPFVNYITPRYARWILANARRFMGIRVTDETTAAMNKQLPERFIAVTNHQSLFDILMIFNLFSRHNMRFVAKKSLGNGFPGVSSILRQGRHALIDRRGSAREMFEGISYLARRCVRKQYCPTIFPEGTRSRTGELGSFQPAGFRMILDQGAAPIVVAAIDGGYKIATVRDFLSKGTKYLHMKVLAVLPPPQGKEETKALLEESKRLIQEQLNQWRQS